LPPWTIDDIASLARKLGVAAALDTNGLAAEDVDSVLHVLGERADGNPLYGRYLSRGLLSGLKAGDIDDPELWLDGSPVIHSDIAVYYKHLYRTANNQAQAIADIFGVIDFAVTEDDL
jgi:hypothetical protein